MFDLFVIAVLLGLIPAWIAHSKGRNLFVWWIYGTVLGIIALPHAILLRDIADDDYPLRYAPRNFDEEQPRRRFPIVAWALASLVIAGVGVFSYRALFPSGFDRETGLSDLAAAIGHGKPQASAPEPAWQTPQTPQIPSTPPTPPTVSPAPTGEMRSPTEQSPLLPPAVVREPQAPQTSPAPVTRPDRSETTVDAAPPPDATRLEPPPPPAAATASPTETARSAPTVSEPSPAPTPESRPAPPPEPQAPTPQAEQPAAPSSTAATTPEPEPRSAPIPEPAPRSAPAQTPSQQQAYAPAAPQPMERPDSGAAPERSGRDANDVIAVGDIVATVQSALIERGYDPGPVNGRADTRTQQAIRKYQADLGLEPTGTIDHTLLERLNILGPRIEAFQAPPGTPPQR